MTTDEAAAGRSGAGLWLLYVVSFYPCWWLAQALVTAVPELLRTTIEGGPARISASVFGLSARGGLSADQVSWTLFLAALAWLGCMAAARRRPAAAPAAAFAAAWVAYALLSRGLPSALFGSEPRAEPLILVIAGFAGMVFSLGRLPIQVQAPSPWRRTITLAGVFALPLVAIHSAPLLFVADFRHLGLPQLAFVVLAALVLAGRRSPAEQFPTAGRFTPGIALGALASVGVFFAAQQAGRALESRAKAERQSSLAPVPDPAPLPPVEQGFFYKGVNFTSEWPEPYGSKAAAKVLASLPAYGVNSVALVPYASQRLEDSALRFPLRMERDDLVEATAKMAHAQGLRVLLKPQVWVRGGYPGDLRYDDPQDLQRWFASYARFVEYYAKLAARIEADMFCVGVEFAQLTRHESEWRKLISLARREYDGPIVYAANFGEEFESVRFWDALDYIGLDNYYPLPEDRSTLSIASKIERVHLEFQKPVLFTEAGFSTYELSHQKPWEDRPGGALSPETQARNVEAVLRGFYGRPWLQGIFWWKVGTSERGGMGDGSHLLWNKPAMDVIGEWFVRPPNPHRINE